MEVRVLHVEHCPNIEATRTRLDDALTALGSPPATVAYQVVRTTEEAAATRLRGSPTILVNGADPFSHPGDPVGLACRLLIPSTAQLREVLADAI